MKRTKILWITALVLGWCFDFLFWGQKQGINFALYVVLCLVGGFLVLARNGIRPAWRIPTSAPSHPILCDHHLYPPGTTDPVPVICVCAWADGRAGDFFSRWALALVWLLGLRV